MEGELGENPQVHSLQDLPPISRVVNKSNNLLVSNTWGSIAQKEGVKFFWKRVRTSPIFLFFTIDLRSAMNVHLLPE